ncbi:MAG: TraB/VirB10 family protein [Thiobacillaceae bacterium]
MSLFSQDKVGAAQPTPRSIGSKAIKRKQSILFAALLLLLGIALVAAVALLNSRKPAPLPIKNDNPVSMSSPIAAPGSAVDEHDAWRGQESAKIAGLEKKLSDLADQLKNPAPSTTPGRSGSPSAMAGLVPGFPPPLPPGLTNPARTASPMVPPPAPPRILPPVPPHMRTSSKMPPAPGMGLDMQGQANGQPLPYQDDGIETGSMDDPATAAAPGFRAMSTTPSAPAKPVKTVGNYVPSGTFVRAVLLSGLDAPTGGQAQSNPQPVLLRMVDDSQLPNRFRSRMKECHIVATGYGDLSSERAYIRTESLSCITQSGTALDVPIKGYVAGEDGKAGMRGRLVTKQGQVLANALIAGIGSGLGQAFQQNATLTSTSALGTTTSVEPGKQFQAGVTAGVGKAFDRLAQYYITLAEKLFPVIEVGAGRTVDVVLTKGADLPIGDVGSDDASQDNHRYGTR